MENVFKLLENLKKEFKKVNSTSSVIQIEEAISLEKIKEAEDRLNFKFPLDFREYISKYGRFAIGELKYRDHIAFKILPIDEIVTAAEVLRDQYDCDTNAEVADEMDVEAKYIDELEKLIIFGQVGYEDYYGFDIRTQDLKTLNCNTYDILLEDSEFEYFFEEKVKKAKGNGFTECINELIKTNNWEQYTD